MTDVREFKATFESLQSWIDDLTAEISKRREIYKTERARIRAQATRDKREWCEELLTGPFSATDDEWIKQQKDILFGAHWEAIDKLSKQIEKQLESLPVTRDTLAAERLIRDVLSWLPDRDASVLNAAAEFLELADGFLVSPELAMSRRPSRPQRSIRNDDIRADTQKYFPQGVEEVKGKDFELYDLVVALNERAGTGVSMNDIAREILKKGWQSKLKKARRWKEKGLVYYPDGKAFPPLTKGADNECPRGRGDES